MRTATGGLAASDSTMPLNISARIAPSIGRSTVHHQSDSGLRSSRESMGGSFGTALPFVADGGLREVNDAHMFRCPPDPASSKGCSSQEAAIFSMHGQT